MPMPMDGWMDGTPLGNPTHPAPAMYSHSPNNSTTSLSDNDDDEVIKESSFSVYQYYPNDVAPAQWSSASTRGCRPQTPATSPASYLPPEILIHILRLVHSVRDLYSALLVSREWCECAVELLWHRPNFSDFSRFIQMLQVIGSEERMFDYARFIRRLNFLYLSRDLTDSLFVRLAKCSKLERLTLVNCVELSDEALLRVLPQCTSLVAIDLTNITSCTDRPIIALAQSATKLQGLNLGGCKNITDEGVLAVAKHCPLLRRIKLSNVKNITNAAVSALAKQCPLLLEIDLQGCPEITNEAVRDVWTYLTHFREVRLAHCAELTDLAFPTTPQSGPAETQFNVQPFPNSIPILSEILPPLQLNRMCETLRMLDLTACALITDEAIAGIISVAPKLKNLCLSKCSLLTDAAVESICKLGKHLHYLQLGHASSITDRSIRSLSRSCTRLRYIDLACCPLLTDLSVFELSGLPKLRRIGLVRVTNLTDQAIFALADRHATLERIHLSYCEHITVLAIHFLLQRVTKLTHLSLTGIPAFRRAELQQFCRSPPREFNTNQRAAFCVYSGKGVENLRLYLAELMAHVQAEANTGDNDSDYYEEEEEEEFPSSSDQERTNDDHAMASSSDPARTPRIPYTREHYDSSRVTPHGIGITTDEVFESHDYGRTSLVPSTVMTVRGHPARTIIDRTQTTDAGPLIVEDVNPSSVATTPSPTHLPSGHAASAPSGSRTHVFGQDLIVEAPTPSPRITPYASRQNAYSVPAFHRHNSSASDGASNRSARSSGTNRTSASNGAGFFRNYNAAGQSSSDAVLTSSRGDVYTPDLVYAEIGHGRGGSGSIDYFNGAGFGGEPGPSTVRNQQQSQWVPFVNGESSRMKSEYLSLNGSDTVLQMERTAAGRDRQSSVLVDTSNSLHRGAASRDFGSLSLARPVPTQHHHDPSSPIPYLSSSPTTRELQESVHSALAGSSGTSAGAGTSQAGIIQEDSLADINNRGRSVRRSLKNTLSVAEHYASALFFRNGNNGAGSSSSASSSVRSAGGSGNFGGVAGPNDAGPALNGRHYLGQDRR
ncbi:RNI-like protein [Sanghuangporus baumii]|uniref:RNI-like protein n=1 Tax=Sanghuangporus baumii TaxID=108892 RepID=A0A9Q5I3V8_SANBA|nr:RNI-like protein [Sanghuangporus baumii]